MQFADQRAVLGIPNGLDVLSNLPFAIAGVWGLAVVVDGHDSVAKTVRVFDPPSLPYEMAIPDLVRYWTGSAILLDPTAIEAFRQHALELPEVVRFYHVAGPIDFLVHVWTKDSEHLRHLAMTAFTSREEVSHIETELIFEHVSCRELPTFVGEL